MHISSILADLMRRLPPFRAAYRLGDVLCRFRTHVLDRNPGRRRQLLAAAVTAGVTSVLGSPVGGVLFSLEVTSTLINVRYDAN